MKETKFKQTEIGQFPEDWEVTNLGSLGKIVGGGTPSTAIPFYWGGNIQWFTPAELSKAGKYIQFSERTLTKEGLANSSAQMMPKGTILLTTRASIGIKSILLGEGCTNQGFQSIIVNESNNNEFVYYLLSTVQNEMVSLASGSTFLEISPSKLSSIKVAIPTIEEQERIAEALSDMDGLLRELDGVIAKKRAIKQGVMQELLTGKRRLEGFTGEWEEKKLGDMLKYEQPTPFIVSSTEYDENGVPVLTAGKTFVLGYTNEDYGVYKDVPIILFDDFTTASKYVDFAFKVKSSAAKILSLRNNDYNLRLIFELMQLIDFPLKDHQRYWISEYSKLVVKIPPTIEEQTAIANILSDMDEEIAALEAKRAKYEQVKQGMMQELLTGKIRLV